MDIDQPEPGRHQSSGQSSWQSSSGPKDRNGRRWLIVANASCAILLIIIGAMTGYVATFGVQLRTTTNLANAIREVQEQRGDRISKMESRTGYIEERVRNNETEMDYLKKQLAEIRASLSDIQLKLSVTGSRR